MSGPKLAAEHAAITWTKRRNPLSAWAVQQFTDALEEGLMFYNLPSAWWRRVRTNNPLERLIRTLRMRLDPMGSFHDESAIERAVFEQLARWHKTCLTGRQVKLTHNT